MREDSMRLSFFVLGATLAAVLLARGARAGEETNELRHRADRADIAMTMAQAPHAREALVRGEAELAEGRVKEAAASFKKAMLAAPKSALAARRYCQVMVELGQRDEALS